MPRRRKSAAPSWWFAPPNMADRYLLESSATDGYLLEDGSGVLFLDAASVALSGTSPNTTWSTAAIALVAGAVALSGTIPNASWNSAAINIAPSALALSGTAPSTTWTVQTLNPVPASLALTGTK